MTTIQYRRKSTHAKLMSGIAAVVRSQYRRAYADAFDDSEVDDCVTALMGGYARNEQWAVSEVQRRMIRALGLLAVVRS